MHAPNGNAIRGDLLKAGHTYASIAEELGVTRQHVREVALGKAVSERVKKYLVDKLGRDPFAGSDSSSAA